MSWMIAIVMFWAGGSIGFLFGAWWAAAHLQQRDLDRRACEAGLAEPDDP